MERPTGMNAAEWADYWVEAMVERQLVPFDRETMIGWFANVAMAGYDAAMQKVVTEITDRDKALMREACGEFLVNGHNAEAAIAAVVAAHEEGK